VGAVAETVGDAALLVAGSEPLYIAAVLHRLRADAALAQRLIEAGRRRVPQLSLDVVAPRLVAAVSTVAGSPR
jgi:hypothetical protein